jgi:putative oxidoreductase
MKIVTTIVRVLLGLMFVVFGSNAFLRFMPVPPLPDTPAGNFLNALFVSKYVYAIAIFQIAGGLLVLIGRYVPLGLTLLGPVIVNIVLFHVFLDQSGLAIAVVVALLAMFLIWRYREAFAGLLRP